MDQTESPSDLVPAPALEFVFRLELTLGPPIEQGAYDGVRRRIIPILGGAVRGPGFQGEVLPGGADWQAVGLGDGLAVIHARSTLKHADGTVVSMINRGRPARALGGHGQARRGRAGGSGLVLLPDSPRFDVQPGPHRWLAETPLSASASAGPRGCTSTSTGCSDRAKALDAVGLQRPHPRAGRDGRRRPVELLGSEAGGRLVARHECGPLLGGNHRVDVVEGPPATLVDEVEQTERSRAPVAQDQLRDRAAELARRRRPGRPAWRRAPPCMRPAPARRRWPGSPHWSRSDTWRGRRRPAALPVRPARSGSGRGRSWGSRRPRRRPGSGPARRASPRSSPRNGG